MVRSNTALSHPAAVETCFQVSLLGLLASGYLAVAGSGYLDLPTALLTALGLFLRLLLVFRVLRFEVSTRVVAAATVAYMGFYPVDYLYLSGEFIPATVHLIFFLAIVRILSARTNRDYFFVKVIAFLELLAATLLSANLNFFLFLALFLVFGVATFCCSEIRRSSEHAGRIVRAPVPRLSWRIAGLTAGMTASILVMTAGLFFVLPRTARAAFRNFISERYHLPGFSNEVTLGQMGAIKMQSTPVMHVRIDGAPVAHRLRWRGASLSHFDGKRWYNPNSLTLAEPIRVEKGLATLAGNDQRRRLGKRIRYEVRIKAMDSDALFFAGVPEFVQIRLPVIYRAVGNSFRTGLGLSEGTYYYAFSHIEDDSPVAARAPQLSGYERSIYLVLPGHDDRIRTLAREVTAGAATDRERAIAIERQLRSDYSYTTDLLDQPVADPLAHFLFDRRKGHCEYFASAMAVMLRDLGIPSRVVTGFQSGTFNPMTGWHLVRASDAHSWVEAWLPDSGWVTFDPTPADPSANSAGQLWSSMLLYLDAAEMFWQQWVVFYDVERQLQLASSVEGSTESLLRGGWVDRFNAKIRSFGASAVAGSRPFVLPSMVALAVITASWFLGPWLLSIFKRRRQMHRVSRGRVSANDATLLYARMLDLLRRRGFEKPAWLTPAEFVRVLPPSPMAVLVEELTLSYHALRYGHQASEGPRLLQLLKQLETSL